MFERDRQEIGSCANHGALNVVPHQHRIFASSRFGVGSRVST